MHACTIPALLVFAFAALLWLLITQTTADADLWGHLRFGLDLLRTHQLPQWDAYSFTTDRAWVNHEWLAELTMAVAYRACGPLGLNILKLIAIGIIATIVLVVARREGAPAIDRALLCTLVVLATYTRTQVIRPQLFSVPLFCVILFALYEAERQRYRSLIVIPFCFALWVNLHGAWIVGLACVGGWLAGAVWTTPERRGALIALGIATVLATLANPYGIGMWRFLAETVRPERRDVTDWKPLLQLPIGIIILDLLLPAIAICGIALRRLRVSKTHLAMIAMLGVATWRVGRVDAFLEGRGRHPARPADSVRLSGDSAAIDRAVLADAGAAGPRRHRRRNRCRVHRGHPAHAGDRARRRMAAGSGQRRNGAAHVPE